MEIDNKIIIVYWKMWQGKTLIALLMSVLDFSNRIYSNIAIHVKNKQISQDINDRASIEKISFSPTPWIIIIDEGWINFNARRSSSSDNQFISELVFLSRKKNCSMLFISQRFESLDKNVKTLSDLILKMHKLRINWKLFFEVEKQKFIKSNLLTIQKFKVDILEIFNIKDIKYNTLESSKLDVKKPKNSRPKKNLLLGASEHSEWTNSKAKIKRKIPLKSTA